MSRKTKFFKTSLFGYSKKPVIDKMEQLESHINSLKHQLEQEKLQHEQKSNALMQAHKQMEDSKKEIAGFYLSAHQNADRLLNQAKNQINKERHLYEVENETLKELIIEKKEAIRDIRLSLQAFNDEMNEYFKSKIKDISDDIDKNIRELDYKYIEKFSADMRCNDIGAKG